jgi:hypothetical protein
MPNRQQFRIKQNQALRTKPLKAQTPQNQAPQSQPAQKPPQRHCAKQSVKRTSQQLRANQLQIKTHYLANKTVTVAYPIHQTMYRHLPDVL